jgi:hypothetical protein
MNAEQAVSSPTVPGDGRLCGSDREVRIGSAFSSNSAGEWDSQEHV